MNTHRRTDAADTRIRAARLAEARPHPEHLANADEYRWRHKEDGPVASCHYDQQAEDCEHDGAASQVQLRGKPAFPVTFTKGMPHNFETGLVQDPQHVQYFIRAIDSGDPRDFRDTPLGPEYHVGKLYGPEAPGHWKSNAAKHQTHTPPAAGTDPNPVGLRAWESQSAGLAFDLEGPDAQAVTMPPAPELGSDELTAEMAEVYAQALLRDVPFTALTAGVMESLTPTERCGDLKVKDISNKPILDDLGAIRDEVKQVLDLTEEMKRLPWFSDTALELDYAEARRRRGRICPTPSSAFRGITVGDDVGPYLSQFLLIGNAGINGNDAERSPADGLISYGAISIDQRVRTATPGVDYMQTWEEWFDVQNAAALGGLEQYVAAGPGSRRFIYTPRDLATYVHYDALYEAYLNACLIMLGNGVPFDPGVPFQDDDKRDHQQGFAHFGGPHILSLVTEVATRALKAVRFQKYNVHRRCRPEVLAARVTKAELLGGIAPALLDMRDALSDGQDSILAAVAAHNGDLRESGPSADANYLLPMAFCEGSPMHPAYGAGHATVAGACVTVLKAFFDVGTLFAPDGTSTEHGYVAVDEGASLMRVPILGQRGEPAHLTYEGELNKLASNIAIGRDWAGVHYFTDYYESILMGERIAIGILEEQKLTFGENFSMTVPLFGGGSRRI